MDDTVTRTRQLSAAGLTPTDVARLARVGALLPLRRGAWLREEPVDDVHRHRLLVRATVTDSPGTVVSHGSAAVLHGLPVLAPLPRVEVTRTSGRGRVKGCLHVHVAALPEAETTVVDGIRVTGLARTVVDLARALPYPQAVATVDAGLRRVGEAELRAALAAAGPRHGIGSARRAVAFADARAESVGESRSRVTLHDLGLPVPTLQLEVRDAHGRLVGRCDFGWERERVLGEFDGRVKYGRLLRAGELAQDVVWREKLREDALRDLGWTVVRWTWQDLEQPAALRQRLERAFARAAA